MSNIASPNVINPAALKHHRMKAEYRTQGQLAKKLGCKVDQVNRWETGRTKKPRKHLLKKLTDALGVTWDDLTRDPPEKKRDEKKELIPTIQLYTRVRRKTRTDLELVSRVFGVPPAAILEIAPLLFLIAANKSLDDRRKKIDTVEEQLKQIIEEIKSDAPHIAPAFKYFDTGDYREAIDSEQESIKQMELFGPFDYYEGEEIEKNNPFSNYIEDQVEELPDGWVEKEYFYTPYHDVPQCGISINILRAVVGISGDTKEDQEILRYVSNGDIDIHELLEKKNELSESDYRKFLSQRYEEAKSEMEARFSDLDLSCLIPSEKEDKS